MYIDADNPSKALDPASGNPDVTQRLLDGRREFLGYLRRRLQSPDDAEDVFQDFSLKVIRATQPVNRDEKINAWLSQILRHTLIDHYRRRAVRLRTETTYAQELRIAEVSPGAAPQAEPPIGSCKCLHAALPRLRPEQTEILRRADLEEEPRTRIAADLGLTTNSLNVRLHRARHALRREMETCCPSCREGRYLDCAHD